MVRRMLAWLTAGLVAPGVRRALGRMAPKRLTTVPPADAEAATGTTALAGAVSVAAGVVGAGTAEAVPEERVATGSAKTCDAESPAPREAFWFCVAGPHPVATV